MHASNRNNGRDLMEEMIMQYLYKKIRSENSWRNRNVSVSCLGFEGLIWRRNERLQIILRTLRSPRAKQHSISVPGVFPSVHWLSGFIEDPL